MEKQVLNDSLDEMDLINIFRKFHSNAEDYTFSGVLYMYKEHSPGSTTSWVTNQTSVNLRKLKSYQAYSPTTVLCDWISITRKKNVKKYKHMEIKQCISK